MITQLESDIYGDFDTEIASGAIGEMVMRQLSTVDQVAYVRFASVYREFKDVQDFVEELQPILQEHYERSREE